jgi:hypothetical protein
MKNRDTLKKIPYTTIDNISIIYNHFPKLSRMVCSPPCLFFLTQLQQSSQNKLTISYLSKKNY